MKRAVWCGIVFYLLMSVSIVSAQPPPTLPPEHTGIWHLAAAGFVSRVETVANRMEPSWRAYQPITVMTGWLLVESGQPVEHGGLGTLYPQAVLTEFLNKFLYFQFGQSTGLKVAPQFLPPRDPKVTGSLVSCEPSGDDVLRVFHYTQEKGFVVIDIVGVVNEAGRLEFANVPSGRYVIGYANVLTRLPTTFLDVR
jgi:hypothetical protein